MNSLINTEENEFLPEISYKSIEKESVVPETTEDISIMVYPNLVSIEEGTQFSINTVIDAIRHMEELKSITNKEMLPVAYFSVVGFNGRKEDQNVTKHTGLIVIDIDIKDNPELDFIALKKVLCRDKYAYACFTSPSGGLKLVVNTNIKLIEQHDAYYLAIKAYLLNSYKLIHKIDTSGSNVARACFLPYDSDAYLNERAQEFYLNETQIEEYLTIHQTIKKNRKSSGSAIDFDMSFDEHCDNLIELIKKRTSIGISVYGNDFDNCDEKRTSVPLLTDSDTGEKRTSVGLYDSIFNNYRFNGIYIRVMRTNVRFLELLILKHCYPYRLDWVTHIDEYYFKNDKQKQISIDGIGNDNGLEVCEINLSTDTIIKEGFRGKTLSSISCKLIFNNPFCHPSLILKEVLRINDAYCENPHPNSNPKPDEKEVQSIFSANYAKFINGELDFIAVIRKGNNNQVSKKHVFKSHLYIKTDNITTQLEAIRVYAEGKKHKRLNDYQQAISSILSEGIKPTQKLIAERMKISTRQLRRLIDETKKECDINISTVADNEVIDQPDCQTDNSFREIINVCEADNFVNVGLPDIIKPQNNIKFTPERIHMVMNRIWGQTLDRLNELQHAELYDKLINRLNQMKDDEVEITLMQRDFIEDDDVFFRQISLDSYLSVLTENYNDFSIQVA